MRRGWFIWALMVAVPLMAGCDEDPARDGGDGAPSPTDGGLVDVGADAGTDGAGTDGAVDLAVTDSSPGVCENGVADPSEENTDCGGDCPACVKTVSQFGITWTFAEGHRVGTFANGDYWVIGPIALVDLDPLPDLSDGLHGYQIDPAGGGSPQAFDKRASSYDASLMPGVPSAASPVKIDRGSVVSTISHTPVTSSCGGKDKYWPDGVFDGCSRSVLKSAAVLTVLDKVPPEGSFRPPYAGSDLTIKHNVADLDLTKLKKLAPVGGVPELASLERHFERPWIDHYRGWSGAFLHPADNMHNYGREIAKRVGEGALVLNLDFAKLPSVPGKQAPSKQTLLVRYVQLGIDLAGMFDAGQSWPADGGHGFGRKLPVLFAGLLLDDGHMLGAGDWASAAVKIAGQPGKDGPPFQEDANSFYVTDAEVAMTASSSWKPDDRAPPRPYTDADIGIPEWGIRHTSEPNRDNFHWSATYRSINGAGNGGFVLAAHIMGLRKLWKHPSLFDYEDRWAGITSDATGTNAWNKLGLAMWQAYRDDYGCRWTRDNPDDTYSQGHYTCGSSKVRCAWAKSACAECTLVKACGDYPDQRSKDYDPCGHCQP